MARGGGWKGAEGGGGLKVGFLGGLVRRRRNEASV